MIEIKRGATLITVSWPASAASGCAAWLRELLAYTRAPEVETAPVALAPLVRVTLFTPQSASDTARMGLVDFPN